MAQPDASERASSQTSAGSVIHVAPPRSETPGNASRESTPLSNLCSRSPTPVASSMTSVDLKQDDAASILTAKSRKRNANSSRVTQGSRNVSGLTGATLYDEDDAPSDSRPNKKRKKEVFPDDLPPRVKRSGSVKEAVKKAASKVKSVLGKRSRGNQSSALLKQLDTGAGGLLEELDLEQEDDAEPAQKRSKRSNGTAKLVKAPPVEAVAAKSSTKKTARKGKLWLSSGLFAGQDGSADVSKGDKKAKTADGESIEKRSSFMPLPMFGFLDHNRDFTLPFDVFAPSLKKGDEKPKDWHQLNRNRLVGEAKELWEKDAPLARSLCICPTPGPLEMGCDEDCLNRLMHYECDDNNCGLPEWQCSNRAFTRLAKRVKKGGAFDIGVEVVKTPSRGFGVRACREFAPGEIIMEYTGEIISEAECQRRMRELYAGKHCYYIMEFAQGFHIDGTKGSMARFVNHSCEPNCEVRMVKVSGTPRMAIFAGDSGVFTGEELTYDYNFDNFSDNKQTCYCGAPSCRGHLARRLNAAEQKVRDREEKERQVEAEKEARRLAAQQEREKETKAKRGSGWRGWVTLSEIKDDLKQQKAAKEEAEKHSTRAQRLASRQSGTTATSNKREKQPARPARKRASSAIVEEEPAEPEIHVDEKRSMSMTSKTGQSKFSEHLEDDSVLENVAAETVARLQDEFATENIAPEEDVETEVKSKVSTSITVKASGIGKTVLKTVEKAVVDSLKHGKVKVMRQSTLSFTKA